MSNPSSGAGDRAFTPPDHPVRNVSVVLAMVVVLLVVAWAGGLVTPRFSIGGSSGSFDIATREGTLAPQLDNEAMTGVEIHGATIVAPGVTTVDATLGVTPLDEHPTVGPGETRPLLVRYVVSDCPAAAPPGEWKVQITTRTALGLMRTIVIPVGHMGPTAACP